MKDLSITQEYLLCSLSAKGRLPVIGKEVPACILAGGLIELLVDGCIKMDEKKSVDIVGALKDEQGYLRSLYNWLGQYAPVKIEKIAREYCLTLTDKRLNELVTDIGNSLAGRACVTPEKGGIMAGKPRFVPNPIEVEKIIQKIRAEMLERGDMADETVALVSLLEKSYQIKRYFSAYETGQLKAHLKEIREISSNQLVKQMVDYIDRMFAVIAVIAAVH
jgi:hypothetical protein